MWYNAIREVIGVFCHEKIIKVYMSIAEGGNIYGRDAFLDCYHDIAYHCTEGYEILLETESYVISLSANGVIKRNKKEISDKKYFETDEDDEQATMLFIGERVLSVDRQDNIYLVRFDDFTLRLIPYISGESINGLHNQDVGSYNRILGCDRHLKTKCRYCGADGEILLDFVDDYIVRCNNCNRSTRAAISLIGAIEDWNNGELNCMVDDIII